MTNTLNRVYLLRTEYESIIEVTVGQALTIIYCFTFCVIPL